MPLVLFACGQSQEELNELKKKRIADSIENFNKVKVLVDSLNEVRAKNIADSIASILTDF